MTPNPIYLRRDPVIRICSFICFGLFGGFLLWAGLVKLDEGVAADGKIIVENNRRIIQHLEGGLVEAISVREGDRVKEGDTLLVLTNTAGVAAQAEVITQIASLSATVMRLEAQREKRPTVDFSALDEFSLTQDAKTNIIERETELFEQETATLVADVAVLRQRAQGALRALIPIRAQRKASLDALAALEDQLERKIELVSFKLARLDEVRVLERDVAAAQSNAARLETEIETTQSSVSDFSNQVDQVTAEYRTRLAQLRLEAQTEIQLLNEKLVAARDVVDRTLITAPQSGKVLNLTFTTVGGVVKPGEPIMEIVPESETIVASIKINPADRASIREGLIVRAQITAFDNRDVPELKGEIINISGDLITDARTQETYYDARVRLETDERHIAIILPGLPVSAFIFSGAERTTLEHILDPLNESMYKGLRGR